MKPLNGKSLTGFISGLALSIFFLFSSGPALHAQDEPDDLPQQEGAEQPAGPRDVGLFRRLNLTPEQIEQLRAIRQQSELELRPLQRRLNQARRALDEAIYSDNLDENLIRERARALAEAQGAHLRQRTLTEVRVRRVLTTEQLQRFRTLRDEARVNQRFLRQQERRNQQRPQGDAFNNNRPNRRAAPPNDNTNNPRPTITPRARRRNSLSRP